MIKKSIKSKRNLFGLKKEANATQDTLLRDVNNLFEHKQEEETYYKLIRVSRFWSNDYIEYENNVNINKTLPVGEHLNNSRPYLKDIVNNLKKSDSWKIQLTIANNFICSIDNDKYRAMHSKSIFKKWWSMTKQIKL